MAKLNFIIVFVAIIYFKKLIIKIIINFKFKLIINFIKDINKFYYLITNLVNIIVNFIILLTKEILFSFTLNLRNIFKEYFIKTLIFYVNITHFIGFIISFVIKLFINFSQNFIPFINYLFIYFSQNFIPFIN